MNSFVVRSRPESLLTSMPRFVPSMRPSLRTRPCRWPHGAAPARGASVLDVATPVRRLGLRSSYGSFKKACVCPYCRLFDGNKYRLHTRLVAGGSCRTTEASMAH
eukprot:scaffold2222_cov28-Tisochrysis_lutea.AAC.6